MSRIKRYNFEIYSILDIRKYLEDLGHKVEKKYFRQINRLFVVDSLVNIDFPFVSIQGPDAYIRFENYPKTEKYEESKKLFEKLKRKFGVKENEKRPVKIKDADKIEIIDYR